MAIVVQNVDDGAPEAGGRDQEDPDGSGSVEPNLPAPRKEPKQRKLQKPAHLLQLHDTHLLHTRDEAGRALGGSGVKVARWERFGWPGCVTVDKIRSFCGSSSGSCSFRMYGHCLGEANRVFFEH